MSENRTPDPADRPRVTLLVREGCASCAVAHDVLERLCLELGQSLTCVDVDRRAETDPSLRAEFGDRVPVVLLDGREHSYWEVDEERLRRDLSR